MEKTKEILFKRMNMKKETTKETTKEILFKRMAYLNEDFNYDNESGDNKSGGDLTNFIEILLEINQKLEKTQITRIQRLESRIPSEYRGKNIILLHPKLVSNITEDINKEYNKVIHEYTELLESDRYKDLNVSPLKEKFEESIRYFKREPQRINEQLRKYLKGGGTFTSIKKDEFWRILVRPMNEMRRKIMDIYDRVKSKS